VTLAGGDPTRSATFARFARVTPGPLACVVEPGHDWEGMLTAEQFRQAVDAIAGEGQPPPWRVRVGVKDAAGKFHASKWIDVDRRPERRAART
jgi:hypothetical protein